MAMMQSYNNENSNEILNIYKTNLYNSLSELDYIDLRIDTLPEKLYIAKIKNKISLVLHLVNEISRLPVDNPLFSDNDFIRLVKLFNEFFNSNFEVDNNDFSITGDIASGLSQHSTDVAKYLVQTFPQKYELIKKIMPSILETFKPIVPKVNTITVKPIVSKVSTSTDNSGISSIKLIVDPIIPSDFVLPEETQKPQNSDKEKSSLDCKKSNDPINPKRKKRSRRRQRPIDYGVVDFGKSMSDQLKNFNILYEKFIYQYKQYMTSGENSFSKLKSKRLKNISCALLCLNTVAKHKISNLNVNLFYAKNHKLIENFNNMYPHLKKLVADLKKIKDVESRERIEKLEEIRKYLPEMLEIVNKMKLNKLSIL